MRVGEETIFQHIHVGERADGRVQPWQQWPGWVPRKYVALPGLANDFLEGLKMVYIHSSFVASNTIYTIYCSTLY